MKKRYLFALLALFLCCTMNAQTRRYYCEVEGAHNAFSGKLRITFDFGPKESFKAWGASSTSLKFVNEKGDEIKFRSMVDAANYLDEKGWTFQQAYASSQDHDPVYHWIFYKEAENFEEAREGILTKEEYDKKK